MRRRAEDALYSDWMCFISDGIKMSVAAVRDSSQQLVSVQRMLPANVHIVNIILRYLTVAHATNSTRLGAMHLWR